jgi:hypothetical protein
VAALLGVIALNRKLYGFFYRGKGVRFAAAAVALHVLYYLYSGLGYLYAWGEFHVRRKMAMRSAAGEQEAVGRKQ